VQPADSSGDDQHALTQKRPPALGTEPLLIHSPWRSCTLAAVSTACLSFAGRARPGTFLKSVAWFSVADLSITACELYIRRELNRAIFKVDSVQPRPAKLWERTPWWTLEDVALYSGGLGLFLTLNPRVIPAVTGWKRFVGAAAVGSAVGTQVNQVMIPSLLGRRPYGARHMEWDIAQGKKQLYHRLQEDGIADASLSRPAQFLLGYYVSNSAFKWLTGHSSKDSQDGRLASSAAEERQNVRRVNEPRETVQFIAEFDKEEMDILGYGKECRRMYKKNADVRDHDALQKHLEHLEKLRITMVTELAYLWEELARKEEILQQTRKDSVEKELLRRELQLLNSMTCAIHMRVAVVEYRVTETYKRLNRIHQNAPTRSASSASVQAVQSDLGADWKKTCRPEHSTEQIRRHLMEKKDQMATMEKWLIEFEKRKDRESVLVHVHAEQIRGRAEALRMNIEATQRLLREFEEQIYRAEFYSEK
jgi:hypothetical protein